MFLRSQLQSGDQSGRVGEKEGSHQEESLQGRDLGIELGLPPWLSFRPRPVGSGDGKAWGLLCLWPCS